MIAHNGEINTLRGNVKWIRARQQNIASKLLGDDLHKIWPLIYDNQSDSASSTMRWNCWSTRLLARARDDADDPGGVGRQSIDG